MPSVRAGACAEHSLGCIVGSLILRRGRKFTLLPSNIEGRLNGRHLNFSGARHALRQLPKIAPRLGRYLPLITREQQYFSQKCPFISVAHPLITEQMTHYNH